MWELKDILLWYDLLLNLFLWIVIMVLFVFCRGEMEDILGMLYGVYVKLWFEVFVVEEELYLGVGLIFFDL